MKTVLAAYLTTATCSVTGAVCSAIHVYHVYSVSNTKISVSYAYQAFFAFLVIVLEINTGKV